MNRANPPEINHQCYKKAVEGNLQIKTKPDRPQIAEEIKKRGTTWKEMRGTTWKEMKKTANYRVLLESMLYFERR